MEYAHNYKNGNCSTSICTDVHTNIITHTNYIKTKKNKKKTKKYLSLGKAKECWDVVLCTRVQQLVADVSELVDRLDVPCDEHHLELPQARELPCLAEPDDDALGEVQGMSVVCALLVQGELLKHLHKEVLGLLWK